MLKYNFLGRPDGLGNRIEQIIMLEAVCLKKNITINYIWNNEYNYRTYNVLFSSSLVEINNESSANVPYIYKGIDPEELGFEKYLNQKEVLNAAKLIKPKFKIHFNCEESPIGIHIRGTDRIGRDHYHFMRDYREFNTYISKTISLINNLKPKYVYICSDNVQYENVFKKHLDRKIKLVKPISEEGIPHEYIDFFALTQCSGIYMCSKFSTFSIIASMIGNIPITSYAFDAVIQERYKAKFEYDLGFNDLKIKNYIKDPAKSKKLLIKSLKFRLKVLLVKWLKFFLNDRHYAFLKQSINKIFKRKD